AMNSFDADALSRALLPAVLEAGRLEMAHFESGVMIERKADKSPVTVADRVAEAIIVEALSRIAPELPVIAEEAVSSGYAPPEASRYFLVDALDGTRLFIKGNPEFSINVALVINGAPVYGMIFGPATGSLYVKRENGEAHAAHVFTTDSIDFDSMNFRRLATRAPVLDRLVAYNSQAQGSRAAGLLKELNVLDARPYGSSLKFCLIAAGEGDLYARLGDTKEWDTAAGQAILEAAGGSVTTLDGQRLTYGHQGAGYLNPHFVAWGRAPLKTWTTEPQ
ncbi:MAG: 3'(2'),5'-bisphosphate nucleotidase CysQ family protein, partial [Hyphomicrobium sp.]